MSSLPLVEPSHLHHAVQFYEDPDVLLETASRFLEDGFQAGDGGVVIARERYRAGLEERLRGCGFEVIAAREEGRYICLDASETMAQFMVAGWPQDESFARVVGGTIAAASGKAQSGRVRVFGEIVALLWAQGNVAAGVRVEQLWNDLGRVRALSLHCGYPMDSLAGDVYGKPFLAVCAEHSQVMPGESFTSLTEDERLRAIAMLQQKAKTLETELAERRESERRKDEFLAMLGHELRNPLSPIVTALELARRRRGDPGSVARSLDVIGRQTQRLNRLVEDLLDVSRLTRGKIELRREVVELAEIVERAVEQAGPLIEARRHRLVLNLPDEPVPFLADPARLEQVVSNLLINAAKYTEMGGRISLAARREAAEVVIAVADDGIGLTPEIREHMFELFQQSPDSVRRGEGGLGVGLTLVRRLVELHGGTVGGESAGPGLGSQFVVRLPVPSR
jgi:signal transduction histidine kinase